jgi:hypothetical protein
MNTTAEEVVSRKLERHQIRLCGRLSGACFFLLAFSTAALTANSAPKGLYIENGRLMKDGHTYAGIGANYQALFGRILLDKNNDSTLINLRRLADKHIAFVRFPACGFWPKGWRLYLDDRAEYFRRMDRVVRAAEEDKIGLIPSLFWHLGTIPQLVGEVPSQLGDNKSKGIAFIKQYTREMVERYKDSPAIWGWEFGNEANLGIDLIPPSRPAFARLRGLGGNAVEPEGGIRLTTAQLTNAYVNFARVVRTIDPSRIIDSGTGVPRAAAWHNARGQARVRDNEEQAYMALLQQNPDPINMLSMHIYQHPSGPENFDHFIARYTRFAAEAGKPLFMGEFPMRNREQAEEYLAAIKQSHVPLSAFWVFDYPPQEKGLNISFENERAFAIDLVAAANQELQGAQ